MHKIPQQLSLAIVGVMLATASPTATAIPPGTGIQGQAFLYVSYGTGIEVEPGLWVGPGSVQLPVQTSFRLLSAHNGREIAQVTTDTSGRYSVPLPPGRYILAPEVYQVSPWLNCTADTDPIEVPVVAKEFTMANIFYFRQGPCSIVWAPVGLGDDETGWVTPMESEKR